MTNSSELAKIKSLRESTGLSFNEIKKALAEVGGDESKAAEQLKALGATMAAKKSSREVKEGVVESYIHTNRKVGSMLELLCETDFVAKNSDFRALAKDLAMHVVAMKPANEKEFLTQPFVRDPTVTVQDLIHQAVAKLGENIQLGGFVVFEL